MCLTAPGLVTTVEGDSAQVIVDGMTRRALTLLTPDVRPGDWVLVWAGAVVSRIPPDEAASIRRAIDATRTPDPTSVTQRGDPT